jgi:hypothetical protein
MACATLIASSAAAKCKPGKPLTPGDHTLSLDFEGHEREVLVHVPAKYDGLAPVALVFDLHGFSGNGPDELALSGFKTVSDMYNFIVVAPTGYMNSWNGDIAFGTARQEPLRPLPPSASALASPPLPAANPCQPALPSPLRAAPVHRLQVRDLRAAANVMPLAACELKRQRRRACSRSWDSAGFGSEGYDAPFDCRKAHTKRTGTAQDWLAAAVGTV